VSESTSVPSSERPSSTPSSSVCSYMVPIQLQKGIRFQDTGSPSSINYASVPDSVSAWCQISDRHNVLHDSKLKILWYFFNRVKIRCMVDCT
jgi:hypothetical protein